MKNYSKAGSIKQSNSNRTSTYRHCLLEHDYINSDKVINPKNDNINSYVYLNEEINKYDLLECKRGDERLNTLVSDLEAREEKIYNQAKEDFIKNKKLERKRIIAHNKKPENINNQLKVPRANFTVKRSTFRKELILSVPHSYEKTIDPKSVFFFWQKFAEKFKLDTRDLLLISEHNDEKQKHYHLHFTNYSFKEHTSFEQVRDNMAYQECKDKNIKSSKTEEYATRQVKIQQYSELQTMLSEHFNWDRGIKKSYTKDEVKQEVSKAKHLIDTSHLEYQNQAIRLQELQRQVNVLQEEIKERIARNNALEKDYEERCGKFAISRVRVEKFLKSVIPNMIDRTLRENPDIKTELELREKITPQLKEQLDLAIKHNNVDFGF